MPFIGRLRYEKLEGKESFVGRPVYKLKEKFAYITRVKGEPDAVICERGFKTDFASIPEWIFFLHPRNGKWTKASVIHDKACVYASKKEMTYKRADDIFYNALLEDNASWFTANFFYFLVRINHLIVGKR